LSMNDPEVHSTELIAFQSIVPVATIGCAQVDKELPNALVSTRPAMLAR